MNKIFFILIPLIFVLIVWSHNQPTTSQYQNLITAASLDLINPEGKTVYYRMMVPEGFDRISLDKNSFGYYLRNLPLKPDGSDVLLYN